MAPVAALILIRPRVEVNAVKSDSLNADAYGEHARTHFPIEAVLVHAEIPRCVPQTQEAGHECGIGSFRGAQGVARYGRRAVVWELQRPLGRRET
jgi:hypothetical protein